MRSHVPTPGGSRNCCRRLRILCAIDCAARRIPSVAWTHFTRLAGGAAPQRRLYPTGNPDQPAAQWREHASPLHLHCAVDLGCALPAGGAGFCRPRHPRLSSPVRLRGPILAAHDLADCAFQGIDSVRPVVVVRQIVRPGTPSLSPGCLGPRRGIRAEPSGDRDIQLWLRHGRVGLASVNTGSV